MDYGILNVGSILLGLISWIIPLWCNFKGNNYKRNLWLMMLSFTFCMISLLLQIWYISYQVTINDWSSLIDTNYVFFVGGIIVIVINLFCNGILLKKIGKKL
ncbi:MAG: hypothetical protein EOM50_01840 [Erysipelotrichia bacterium]|nr:hypothetical protein [Erysipelotrichia bacterium]